MRFRAEGSAAPEVDVVGNCGTPAFSSAVTSIPETRSWTGVSLSASDFNSVWEAGVAAVVAWAATYPAVANLSVGSCSWSSENISAAVVRSGLEDDDDDDSRRVAAAARRRESGCSDFGWPRQ